MFVSLSLLFKLDAGMLFTIRSWIKYINAYKEVKNNTAFVGYEMPALVYETLECCGHKVSLY
jgi:hypothetical protein